MHPDHFAYRHLGPRTEEVPEMLEIIGVGSLDELIDKTIPANIRLREPLPLQPGIPEHIYLNTLKQTAGRNKMFKTYIGAGYYPSILPSVIRRNILENPVWYTSYTPYQAEIAQGRLEALLNFQTMVSELTGLEIANASLLDEATAAAEAMIMLFNARSREKASNGANRFFADMEIFPQTLAVIQGRAAALGIEVMVGSQESFQMKDDFFGALIQYPNEKGSIINYSDFMTSAKGAKVPVVVAADLLSLALLTPMGHWGASVAIGSTQRFGIPIAFGGPHAAFFATCEQYKRHIPGRIIGVTTDREGRNALRMALQTREQHIKREKATSNICTAQALLATMAGMYAVYHGHEGLVRIAGKVHQMATALEHKLTELGFKQLNPYFFDTLRIGLPEGIRQSLIAQRAVEREINFRYLPGEEIGISLDETTSLTDLNHIAEVFSVVARKFTGNIGHLDYESRIDPLLQRNDGFMNLQLFKRYRSETEMMRYIHSLASRDFSLAQGMIPLGSCTMKLNAATEMIPLCWDELAGLHPFVPLDQTEGYQQIMHELGQMLLKITGFRGISFQPNSGAAGEYTGLLVIRQYHLSRAEGHRNVVLIPASAHGTNPASAAMAGFQVVVVNCDERGNVDLTDLHNKAALHKENLGALMVTYPSTHGVFESSICEITALIHGFGGQVYMDGANMNAQVGLTNPAIIGADVCHLNLHKTFAIPHGGGGPGMGPILVADHLVPFLPNHPVAETGGMQGIQAVSAAPWGSAGILVISHAYCSLLGAEGLTEATRMAILNANYLASLLNEYFPVLYTGENGFVGHEMILDCRKFKQMADVSETDIAKRLMDYGFHAPTLSFPVHGTLMVEPTESESKQELDRFAVAMKGIYNEIIEIASGGSKEDNLLKNSPHTQSVLLADEWKHAYSRMQAAFPGDLPGRMKFWPTVSRVDDAYGDRNLVCTCLPIDDYR